MSPTRQQFKTADVLRLEIGAPPATGYRNLAKNPNGENGAWGWVTPTGGGASYVRGNWDAANPGVWMTGPAVVPPVYVETEPEPVTVGHFGAGQIRALTPSGAGGRVRLSLVYYDKTGVEIGVHHGSYSTDVAASTVLTHAPAAAIPANTTHMALRVALDNTAAPTARSFRWDRTMVTTGTVAVTGLTYVDPYTYTNVLGAGHEITVDRAGLTLGTLNAVIFDPTIDPATTTLIRPGNPVRLMARTADSGGVLTSAYEPIFTGEVSKAAVGYDLTHPNSSKRSRITLTAVDAAARLAKLRQPAGVATMADLRYLLEGCGVPWNIAGTTELVPGAPAIASRNDNASVLDQVSATRDTVLGHAWVTRTGVLYANTAAGVPTTVQATLGEADYKYDIDIDYDTQRCINVVTIKRLALDAAGETVETVFGPYEDAASIKSWGAFDEEFTVQGLADNAVETHAASILTANSVPKVRCNRVRLAIASDVDFKNAAGSRRAHLDLFDRVTVNNTRAALSETLRAAGIKHTITTDKWTMDLSFAGTGGVSMPAPAPPVPLTTAGLLGGVFTAVGPFSTSAPPNGTSGQPLVIDTAGTYQFDVQLSGFAGAAGLQTFHAYIDGVEQSNRPFFHNAVNEHHTGPRMVWQQTLAPGTHYLWCRHTGSTDNNDVLSATWTRVT